MKLTMKKQLMELNAPITTGATMPKTTMKKNAASKQLNAPMPYGASMPKATMKKNAASQPGTERAQQQMKSFTIY